MISSPRDQRGGIKHKWLIVLRLGSEETSLRNADMQIYRVFGPHFTTHALGQELLKNFFSGSPHHIVSVCGTMKSDNYLENERHSLSE